MIVRWMVELEDELSDDAIHALQHALNLKLSVTYYWTLSITPNQAHDLVTYVRGLRGALGLCEEGSASAAEVEELIGELDGLIRVLTAGSTGPTPIRLYTVPDDDVM